MSLAAKLSAGKSRDTLGTLLFLGSTYILRQGQAFFTVLIQPLSLHTHTHMALLSLWGHHKKLQPQDKPSALCVNWFYLCGVSLEDTQRRRGSFGAAQRAFPSQGC